MTSYIKIYSIFRTMMMLFGVMWYAASYAAEPARANMPSLAQKDSLKDRIEERTEELQKIQNQRKVLEQSLEKIAKSSNKLSYELQSINTNIAQLQLSLKANTITLQTLDGDITSLGDDIQNIKRAVSDKENTVQKLFTELQTRDNENPLLMFFKKDNLSESVAEFHATTKVNAVLMKNIDELQDLKNALIEKLGSVREKKYVRQREKVALVSRQQIIEDQKQEKQDLLVKTRNEERVYEAQISALEKLQEEISSEVEKIESELRKGIDPNLLPNSGAYSLLWPIPDGHKTQEYGSTKFALKHYKGKFHNGIDIGGVPIGSDVLAAEDGIVINVGNQDAFCPKGAYGKMVVIKHNNGLTTLYGHLSKYIVSIGSQVKRGDVIGYMGKTGYATGPHLHFIVFATQTIIPARPGYPEGTKSSRCGPMPVGGHINPTLFLTG